MPKPSLELLQSAVLVLSLFCLVVAVAVFLRMEIRYHNQLAREARRIMLANLLIPSWDGETLREVWSSSRPWDREILEEILVAHRQALEPEEGQKFEQAVINSGIYDHWLEQLRAGPPPKRVMAAQSVGHFHDPRGVEALVAGAEDPSPEVQLAIVLSLGRLRDPAGLPGLMALSKKPSKVIPELTHAAAHAACASTCPERLLPLLQASETRLRLIGAWALSEVANASVLPQLREAARDVEPEVRAKVARALGHLPNPESVETLVTLTRDPVWFVRVRAFDALGKLRTPAAESVTLAGLGDKIREVRHRAAYALRQIAGMECSVALQVFREGRRRDFNSLLSEWERAGFLWWVVGDLSARNRERFEKSREFLKTLVAAGVTRALEDFVQGYPNLRVRLRVMRLLAEASSPQVRVNLLALASQPGCDRRMAAAIRARLAGPAAAAAGGGGSA